MDMVLCDLHLFSSLKWARQRWIKFAGWSGLMWATLGPREKSPTTIVVSKSGPFLPFPRLHPQFFARLQVPREHLGDILIGRRYKVDGRVSGKQENDFDYKNREMCQMKGLFWQVERKGNRRWCSRFTCSMVFREQIWVTLTHVGVTSWVYFLTNKSAVGYLIRL